MTNPRAHAPLRGASVLRRRSAGALLGALTAFGAAASAFAADVDQGEKLARRWCAACHIVANDQTHGADNVPPFATIATIPGFGADKIALLLRDPHPKMPDMQLSLPETEDLAAYIIRQAK
jgi:mono/diheme cytochrome c family protein